MTYLSDTIWSPRTYYILRNKTSGKKYIGQTTQNINNYLGSGGYWKSHCKKHGGYNKTNIELVWYQFFVCERSAKQYLEQFTLDNPNYYSKDNTDWANECLENTNDSPFKGGEIQRKRSSEGTHPFQGGLIQRETMNRLSSENNHPLQRPEIRKRISTKRKEEGTYSFTDEEFKKQNRLKMLERVKNGTHNLLGGEIQRRTAKRLISEGRHCFQGLNTKRINEGTHNFVGTINCRDKNGKSIPISKEVYYNQTGPSETWEYVANTSKEGKRRKQILTEIL